MDLALEATPSHGSFAADMLADCFAKQAFNHPARRCCAKAPSLVVAMGVSGRQHRSAGRSMIERLCAGAYNVEGVSPRYTISMLGGLDDNERHHISSGR